MWPSSEAVSIQGWESNTLIPVNVFFSEWFLSAFMVRKNSHVYSYSFSGCLDEAVLHIQDGDTKINHTFFL